MINFDSPPPSDALKAARAAIESQMVAWGFDNDRPDQRFWLHMSNNSLGLVANFRSIAALSPEESTQYAAEVFGSRSADALLSGMITPALVAAIENAYQHSSDTDVITRECAELLKGQPYPTIAEMEKVMMEALAYKGHVAAEAISATQAGGLGDIANGLKSSEQGRRGG